MFSFALSVPSVTVNGQTKISAEHLLSLIPEDALIANRAGLWDVTETVWASPGAKPVTTTGLVAERRMTGSMLQEFLRDSAQLEIKRTDLLAYNHIEGRWDYVSYDARVPLGLMPAWSTVKGDGKSIELSFSPLSLPGTANAISGQMLRMDQTISYTGQDSDVKDQYFMLADGTATRWLAHRYAYNRRDSQITALPAEGKSSRIDEIRKRGTLRVAVVDEYPWLKATRNGDVGPPFEGPAWVLAEEFAKRLGVRLETVDVNFDGKIAALNSGNVDITIAPLLVTPERIKTVDMISYSLAAQTLFGKRDNPKLKNIKSIDQLNKPGITIAYIEGSPQGKWLIQRLPRAKKIAVKGNLADVPLNPVLIGNADVANIDKFFFAGLAEKNPGLVSIPWDFMSSMEFPLPIGMAIKKGQPVFLEWLRAVNEEVKWKVRMEEASILAAKKHE